MPDVPVGFLFEPKFKSLPMAPTLRVTRDFSEGCQVYMTILSWQNAPLLIIDANRLGHDPTTLVAGRGDSPPVTLKH